MVRPEERAALADRLPEERAALAVAQGGVGGAFAGGGPGGGGCPVQFQSGLHSKQQFLSCSTTTGFHFLHCNGDHDREHLNSLQTGHSMVRYDLRRNMLEPQWLRVAVNCVSMHVRTNDFARQVESWNNMMPSALASAHT